MTRGPRPPYAPGRQGTLLSSLLIGAGGLILAFAATLPVGHLMAESENIGLLLVAMFVLAVVGVAVIAVDGAF
jgi:hypothetical protein